MDRNGQNLKFSTFPASHDQPVINVLSGRSQSLKGDAGAGVWVLVSFWPLALTLTFVGTWTGEPADSGLLRKGLCLNVTESTQTYKLLCKSISSGRLSVTEQSRGHQSFPNCAFVSIQIWFWKTYKYSQKTPNTLMPFPISSTSTKIQWRTMFSTRHS